ncbi:MAG: Ig-like domain-containing protein [Bacteroidota bacterium]
MNIKRMSLLIGSLFIFVVGAMAQENEWLRAEMYTVPVSTENNLGTTNLFWQVTGSDSSVLTVDQGSGETDFAAGGATGNASADSIQKGTISLFRLYTTNGTSRMIVDSISVSGTDPLPNSSIGLNAFPLFAQYLGISQGNSDYQNEAHRKISKAMARKSIISASEIGTQYLRVMVSGFYSPTLDVLRNDSVAFWSAMDELMAEFKANEMKIIPSLAWNLFQFSNYFNETVTDYMTNSNSQSYLLLKKFIHDFVTRYKDEDVVLFYELGNEYNLYADLKIETNPWTGEPYTGKFTTAQLSDFQKRTANFIRSLDPAAMVTSGNAMPRPSAYHLMLQPAFSPSGADWTVDNVDQFKQYVKILEEGVDVISMHIYNGSFEGPDRFGITDRNSAEILTYAKQASDEAGKLLFMGEFGDYDPMIQQDTNAVFTQNMFNKIAELDIPFSAPWIWDFYQFSTYEFTLFQIEQGFTDFIIEKYKQANVNLGNPPVIIADPDTVKPLVVLTFPKGNGEYANPQLLHAVASDNSGSIARVEFYVNEELIFTDTEPPYQFSLVTDTLSVKTTELTAKAYDKSGNTASYILEANPDLVIATGTITADPDTVTRFVDNGEGTMVGTVVLSWSATGCENTLVYVSMDHAEPKLMSNAPLNFTETIEWIQPDHTYTFYLASAYGDLTPVALLDSVVVVGAPVTGVEDVDRSDIVQLTNYPNPFSDHTLIRFDKSVLQSGSSYNLLVFDVMGRLMERIILERSSGSITFNRGAYPSGIYHYVLQVDGKYVASSSMVIK